MRGIIPLDVFNLDVAVYATEKRRLKGLRKQGCTDLTEHSAAALSSAHRDFTEAGSVRLSMVIKDIATKATWAHECVHIADFVMDHLQLPTGEENTEIRAYMVGHMFSKLEEIMEKPK